MRAKGATLVDLLDRILERGVVLDADLLVTIADVPLLAVSLRAAVAGVKAMAEHGLMRDWIAPVPRVVAPPRPVPALARPTDGAGPWRPCRLTPVAGGVIATDALGAVLFAAHDARELGERDGLGPAARAGARGTARRAEDGRVWLVLAGEQALPPCTPSGLPNSLVQERAADQA